jgi:hypothetical protein
VPLDFERALGDTEDFLRRQLGSRAAREAQKRKVQRGIGEVMRRIRRATLLFLGLIGALLIADLTFADVGFLWLVALPTFLIASLLALFWPSRRAPARSPSADLAPSEHLDELAGRTENWLLERCSELPRAALPAADTILIRLREMQPGLARLPAEVAVAGEARRLIGRHLPRLVDCYLELPPERRQPQGENERRFAESLEIVADELDRLSGEISRDRLTEFETQRRFLETRYRDES